MRTTREPGEIFGPRMTLFADVLSVGLATAVASLPLPTAPAALSTACEILRGTREDRPATAGRYFRLLRQRLRAGDLVAGLAAVAGVLLVLADLAMLARTALPGGPAFAAVAAAIGAYAAVTVLRACGRPESLTAWPPPYAPPPGTPHATPAAAPSSSSPWRRPPCVPGRCSRSRSCRRAPGDGAHGDGAHGDGAHGDGAHGDGAHGDRRTHPHGPVRRARRHRPSASRSTARCSSPRPVPTRTPPAGEIRNGS